MKITLLSFVVKMKMMVIMKGTMTLVSVDRSRASIGQSETEDSLLPEKGPGDDTMDL